jgi:aryl-alcohol dehydrogenase-like predicted oxidoreductase
MQKRGNRSEIVLATKFTSAYKTSWEDYPIHANYTGNSSKSLRVSVEDSLKKLQTDYIDLLYVHWWYVPFLIDLVMRGIILLRLRSWLIPLMTLSNVERSSILVFLIPRHG